MNQSPPALPDPNLQAIGACPTHAHRGSPPLPREAPALGRVPLLSGGAVDGRGDASCPALPRGWQAPPPGGPRAPAGPAQCSPGTREPAWPACWILAELSRDLGGAPEASNESTRGKLKSEKIQPLGRAWAAEGPSSAVLGQNEVLPASLPPPALQGPSAAVSQELWAGPGAVCSLVGLRALPLPSGSPPGVGGRQRVQGEHPSLSFILIEI